MTGTTIRNPNKLKEVSAILGPSGVHVDSRALDIPEIQGTTKEVTIAKCRRAAEIVGGPCIVEDTALAFKALNGLPGPYIKQFLENLGHDGLNTLLEGFFTKEATAICTFGYSSGPGTEPLLFIGETEGRIVPPRGPPNFGWDPIFEVEDTGETYAEMSKEKKNTLSHRYRALDKLQEYLKTLL